MNPVTWIIAYIAVLAIFVALCAVWLWFILRRPAEWLAFSDRTDDALVRFRLMPRSVAEASKRLARGWGRTMLIALVTGGMVVGGGGFFFFGAVVVLRHCGWLHW